MLVYDKLPFSLRNKGLRVFKGDISDKKTLKRAVDSSDIVVNLVGSFEKDIYAINVLGSANLLEVCKESNIKKIIFISSQAVYGNYHGVPCFESDCPKPMTEYGFSKYIAEKIYKFYFKEYNIPTIILRLSNTYGPDQKAGVIFEFLSAALKNQPIKLHKDGKQCRDFLYVDDAVDGIAKSIDYKTKGFEIFNMPGKRLVSLLEFIALIEKNIGKKVRLKFLRLKRQDIKYMCSNYRKAKRLLGYEPKVSLEEGIARTIRSKLNEKIRKK